MTDAPLLELSAEGVLLPDPAQASPASSQNPLEQRMSSVARDYARDVLLFGLDWLHDCVCRAFCSECDAEIAGFWSQPGGLRSSV